ncbi:MAG TPA: Cof-type HAD-IIB family hydrolase [Bacillota bacterium]|jgi:Cof subfamily protein (haloacid dehalogenase superfamily)|nr:HAD family phosphatase [Bacillota bacterium]HOB87560.1 Cof-type HAD-IIB family hydrolase [Bacillota bacterium]HOP68164.1 Cof-type HAD-IIB family hydrolase [Bacillota bacterium]HPT33034.1 Cof-type HAD-IIB family hydrolase [Bacillota bacterium]HPZ64474.1 Cof-type HAD-IIB family hydrolase [Bacillota bacterium]
MKYRLLAIDLDETLLDGEQKISPRNKRAVREAVKRGAIITIATGRMFRTSLPHVRELELNMDWPMINYHGALIKTTETGTVIHHQPVDLSLALPICRMAEERGFHVNLFIDDRLFIREDNEIARYYQRLSGVDAEVVGPLSAYLEQRGEPPSKITIIDQESGLDPLQEILRDRFGDQVNVLKPYPIFLEVTHARATKGQALQRLAGMKGIKREEIIAFGDSYNDIDMLQYAGLGVAVANAPEEVRAAADLITSSNLEDGVARVIEEYVLK